MSEPGSDFSSFFSVSLPCAAEKSISGCGRERADIQRSLSLLQGENSKEGYIIYNIFHFVMWQPTHAFVSVSYCVSVRRNRASFDMCSLNRFFWREWSLTRQFSARRSDTGECSITVNLPPLETANSTEEKWDSGRKNCDKIFGTIKDCGYEGKQDVANGNKRDAAGDRLF